MQNASLQNRRSSFPRIGLSELPSIMITKKPVTPQKPGNNEQESQPKAILPAQESDRMSRRDQYLYNQIHTPYRENKRPRHGLAMVEVAVSPYPQAGYNRLVLSPTNVSVYNNRTVADSLQALSIHGEKLTPQCSPRGSPTHSPNRYTPYMVAVSQNTSPVQGHHFGGFAPPPHHHHHSVGQSGSNINPHRSPTNSVYNGSPAHSPSRFFHSDSRRNSDLSNYSGDDVSLKNYITQAVVQHPAGVVYANQQSPFGNEPVYTPLSIAIPLHPRPPPSSKGSVSSRDNSPNSIIFADGQHNALFSRQSTQMKDMSTQTFNPKETTLKPRHLKHRRSKKTRHNTTVQQNAQDSSQKDMSLVVHRDKSVTVENHKSLPPTNAKDKRKKAVLVMKTVTTVTPTPDSTSTHKNGADEPACYSRESTIHIDIAYDGNSTAEDILKSAVIADIPNARITASLGPEKAGNVDSISAPASPSHDRRSSVSGPIPEISLICATPDDLTPASPGIPRIDGEDSISPTLL